jgi:aromatic ring hydroxylase
MTRSKSSQKKEKKEERTKQRDHINIFHCSSFTSTYRLYRVLYAGNQKLAHLKSQHKYVKETQEVQNNINHLMNRLDMKSKR